VTRDRDTEVWRTKDDRLWRIGGDAETAWIQKNTESGRAITSAIPPIFAAYATLELPGTGDHDAASWFEDPDRHDAGVLAVLSEHTAAQPWWLGYLDTDAADIQFRDVPKVTLYSGCTTSSRPRWDGPTLTCASSPQQPATTESPTQSSGSETSEARSSRSSKQSGDRMHYTYDFGDSWEHDIVLEKQLDPDPGEQSPTCLAGKGACPPEDCGGSWGYADLKESLADPSHEAHEDMHEWLGLDNAADFDPTACNVAEINDVLRMTIASRSARASAW
jgi:hypothetical protein